MCNLSWTPHSNLEKDNSLKTTPVLAQRWAVWSILTKNCVDQQPPTVPLSPNACVRMVRKEKCWQCDRRRSDVSLRISDDRLCQDCDDLNRAACEGRACAEQSGDDVYLLKSRTNKSGCGVALYYILTILCNTSTCQICLNVLITVQK